MEHVETKKPALIGGAVVGLLSVMPIVQMGNACFCLWALVGGAVAAKLLIDHSPQPLVSRDGARIGLLAGLFGALIYFVIETPITILQMSAVLESAKNMPFANDEARAIYERIGQNQMLRVLLALLFTFIGSVLLMGFTVLGGMLGVAIFEKRKGV